MTTIELINSQKCKKNFSFEVLPPLKGNGTGSLFNTIDKLKEFNSHCCRHSIQIQHTRDASHYLCWGIT